MALLTLKFEVMDNLGINFFKVNTSLGIRVVRRGPLVAIHSIFQFKFAGLGDPSIALNDALLIIEVLTLPVDIPDVLQVMERLNAGALTLIP